MSEIVVVTWNIKFGVEIDRALDVIGADEVLSQADVLLLQELDAEGAHRMAGALGHDVVYRSAGKHPQTGRDFGNAILASGPLTDVQIVDLPHRAAVQGTPRLALGARTEVGGIDLSAWCTHTETPILTRERRLAQFRRVAEAVAGDDGPRLVVGGDFNTVTRRGIRTLERMMEEAGARRIAPSPDVTIRRGGRSMTLDHLFVRGLRPVGCGVVAAAGASDHDATWAAVVDVSRQ